MNSPLSLSSSSAMVKYDPDKFQLSVYDPKDVDIIKTRLSIVDQTDRYFKVVGFRFGKQRPITVKKGLLFKSKNPFPAARKAWTKVCRYFHGSDELEKCVGTIVIQEKLLGDNPGKIYKYAAKIVKARAGAHRSSKHGGKVYFKYEAKLKSLNAPPSSRKER